jgi:hypothetical protein
MVLEAVGIAEELSKYIKEINDYISNMSIK